MFETTIEGFNKAVSIIKNINNLNRTAEISTLTVELNSVIMDVQTRFFNLQAENQSLTTKIRELEQKIANSENWNTDKEKYKLVEWKHGISAYIAKETMNPSKESMAFCATCFNNKKQSPLQITNVLHTKLIKCGGCNFEQYASK